MRLMSTHAHHGTAAVDEPLTLHQLLASVLSLPPPPVPNP
jgi:hypothetical protein